MHGIPGREERERASWRWWNIAAGVIVAIVAVTCAAGAYSFWWLLVR